MKKKNIENYFNYEAKTIALLIQYHHNVHIGTKNL